MIKNEIQTYPGSPPLETVISVQDCDVFIYGSCTQLRITYSEICKYPEYWQPLPKYDKRWADSLVGNLFSISKYIGANNLSMSDRLNEYATELSEYFKDNLE